MPERIQRKREKGWKMPANTVSVARPGKWGNMFVVWCNDEGMWTVSRSGCHYAPDSNTKASASALAVKLYREFVTPEGPQHFRGAWPPPTPTDIIRDLRGKNLACFCGIGDPCHGDVLLEIANAPISTSNQATPEV